MTLFSGQATRRFATGLSGGLLALIALAACSPLTALNALSGSDAYRSGRDIAYGPLPRQKLDVYMPAITAATPKPPGGWPVVVFFYGGSWNTGERGDYRFLGAALAERGILVIVADYRLYPEVRFPEFLRDSALALAWGLDNATRLGGDRQRVFVMGHSAGAYNAAMLALDPRWLAPTGHDPKRDLAGWIGLAGPYEFLPLGPGPAQAVFFHPDYPPGTQPIELVTAGAPPAFLGAPTNDKVVSPRRSTIAMASKLETAGVPVQMKLYGGITHALVAGAFARPLRGLAPVLDDVVGFVVLSAASARPDVVERPTRPS